MLKYILSPILCLFVAGSLTGCVAEGPAYYRPAYVAPAPTVVWYDDPDYEGGYRDRHYHDSHHGSPSHNGGHH